VDATTIAVTSILVTGITAILVPLITARAERSRTVQRFRQERLIRDFDELRSLLDEIAAEIPPYFNAVAAMESRHTTSGSTDFGDYSDELSAYTEIREQLRRLRARLVIRLGRTHPVVSALQQAVDPIDLAGNEVVTMITLEEPPTKQLAEARPTRRQGWYLGYERYLDAAGELVGSPVESLLRAPSRSGG
jgi:hypothetical protein